MKKQRNKIILALLLSICMLFNITNSALAMTMTLNYYNGNVSNQGGSIASPSTGNSTMSSFSAAATVSAVTKTDSITLLGEPTVVTGSAIYYVGGNSADDIEGNGTSSVSPFSTLSYATSIINTKEPGDYSIIVQGSTEEVNPIIIGEGTKEINITINCISSEAVTGAAIKRDSTNSGYLVSVEESASLTLGGTTDLNRKDLVFDGGSLTSTDCAMVYIKSNGTLNLNSGVLLKNNYNNRTAYDSESSFGGAIKNNGTFNMYGGTISNNIGGIFGGGVCNLGYFNMYGGAINSNTSQFSGGGVYNGGTFLMDEEALVIDNIAGAGCGVFNTGDFNFSGGEISGNTGIMVYGGEGIYNTTGTLTISGDAYIPTTEEKINDIFLESNALVIGSTLSSSGQIAINPISYSEGYLILLGSPTVSVADNISKFKLVDSDFSITNDGKVTFIGDDSNYYVNVSGNDDTNEGSESKPFATIRKAVDTIGNKKGNIIIQSDLTESQWLTIGGKVTIKSDGNKHIVKLVPPGVIKDVGMITIMPGGTLSLGNSDNIETTETLVFDCMKIPSYFLIKNRSGVLNLNAGVAITNYNCNLQCIYNDKGTINMYGGRIGGNVDATYVEATDLSNFQTFQF